MSARFLAIDLGAESGRAILGALDAGRLTLTELHRFPNEAIRDNSGLRWNVNRLWTDIQNGLDAAAGSPLNAIGLDTWGCDYGLLDAHGQLLENPFHYRDTRTDGVQEIVAARVGKEALYRRTGCQLLPFNTLFQLYAASQQTPQVIAAAHRLLMMPDLFNYWLTGEARAEYTIASTSQMTDPRSRQWETTLLDELGLPSRLLQPMVEPGTAIGRLRGDACAGLAGTPVVAPAGHDTGSAFAAVGSAEIEAVISSGTWSLLGSEAQAPVVTERARQLNFTNEGGVCGTTRVLKNITGMWLLQSCNRAWTSAGHALTYDELLAAAAQHGHQFESLIDPDHRDFFHPTDMPSAIGAFCRRTGQPEPADAGATTRVILESLALKYRLVVESLEELIGRRCARIRIVGGGSRNRLLCRFTADATGRPVIAGPVEATALGNIAMQMVATGAVSSIEQARAIIDHSFPGERFEPADTASWDKAFARFVSYVNS